MNPPREYFRSFFPGSGANSSLPARLRSSPETPVWSGESEPVLRTRCALKPAAFVKSTAAGPVRMAGGIGAKVSAAPGSERFSELAQPAASSTSPAQHKKSLPGMLDVQRAPETKVEGRASRPSTFTGRFRVGKRPAL